MQVSNPFKLIKEVQRSYNNAADWPNLNSKLHIQLLMATIQSII